MARSQTPETAPRRIPVPESLLVLFGCNQNAIGKARAALAAHKINLKAPSHAGREQHEDHDQKCASPRAKFSPVTGASLRRIAHEVMPARAPTANSKRYGRLKSVTSQVIGQHFRVSKISAGATTAKVKSPIKKIYGARHSRVQPRLDIYDLFDDRDPRNTGDLATDNRNDSQSDVSQSEHEVFLPEQDLTQSNFTLKDRLVMRRQAPKSPIRISSNELVPNLNHIDACLRRTGIVARPAEIGLRRGGSLLLSSTIDEEDEEGGNNNVGQEQEDPDGISFQTEYLDDLERELLGEHGTQSPTPLPPSRTQHRHSTEVSDVQHSNDAEVDELGTHPAKKQHISRANPRVETRNAVLQGLGSRKTSKVVKNVSRLTKKSAAKKKKKKPRRFSVDELVTISDKLDISDVETPGNVPAELLDDPISQLAEEFGRPKKAPVTKPKVKGAVRNFGKINAVRFRIPSQRQRRLEFRSSPSYCDGFEGEEAAPLRIYMPIRRAPQRREARDKVLILFPTLTIVANKVESDEIEIEIVPQRCEKKKRKMTPEGQRLQEKSVKKLTRQPNLHDEENSMAFYQDIQNNESLPAENEPVTKSTERDTGASQNPLHPEDEEQKCLEKNNIFSIQEDGIQDYNTKIQRQTQNASAAANSDSLPKTPVSETFCVNQESKLSQAESQTSPTIRKDRNRANSQFLSTARLSQYQEACQNSKQVASARRKIAQIRVSQEIAAVSVPRRSLADSDESDQESTSDNSSTASYPGSEDKHESDAESDDIGYTTAEIEQGKSQVESLERLHNDQRNSPLSEVAELLNNQPQLALQHISHQSFEIQFSGQYSLFTPTSAQSLVTGHFRQDPTEEESMMTGSDATQQEYQYEDPDASWRPRIPDTDCLSMELENDKIESPTRPPSFSGAISRPRRSSRHLSTMRGQPQPLTATRPMTPLVDSMSVQSQNPQGSPVLRGSQVSRAKRQQSQVLGESQFSDFRSRTRVIPETQFEDGLELLQPATPVDPSKSYFSFASCQLRQPFRSMAISRTKSSPAPRVIRPLNSEQALLSMSQAFRNTNSSMQKTYQRPMIAQKDLSTLTRQSSMRMGTRPATARKKSVNIPPLLSLNPRFKKDGSSQPSIAGKSQR